MHSFCTPCTRFKHGISTQHMCFFALKSYLCFFLVWGVCKNHLHFLHDLFICICSVYPLCRAVHTSRIQHAFNIFQLLYSRYSTFFNMRSVHSLSTPRASYHACLMHALCTLYARPMHTLCTVYAHPLQALETLQACNVSPLVDTCRHYFDA